jgi:hypothetical protein
VPFEPAEFVREDEMGRTSRTAGYNWTDHKTNIQIAKEFKITPILDKLLEYKRNWIVKLSRCRPKVA